MHQIVLLTALSATTGLFGGGRCHRGHHAYFPARGHAAAPAYGQCGTCPQVATYAPQVAPATQTAQVAQPVPYTSYYYPPASSCPNGQCYRR